MSTSACALVLAALLAGSWGLGEDLCCQPESCAKMCDDNGSKKCESSLMSEPALSEAKMLLKKMECECVDNEKTVKEVEENIKNLEKVIEKPDAVNKDIKSLMKDLNSSEEEDDNNSEEEEDKDSSEDKQSSESEENDSGEERSMTIGIDEANHVIKKSDPQDSQESEEDEDDCEETDNPAKLESRPIENCNDQERDEEGNCEEEERNKRQLDQMKLVPLANIFGVVEDSEENVNMKRGVNNEDMNEDDGKEEEVVGKLKLMPLGRNLYAEVENVNDGKEDDENEANENDGQVYRIGIFRHDPFIYQKLNPMPPTHMLNIPKAT